MTESVKNNFLKLVVILLEIILKMIYLTDRQSGNAETFVPGQIDELNRLRRLRPVSDGKRFDVAILHHRRVSVDATTVDKLQKISQL